MAPSALHAQICLRGSRGSVDKLKAWCCCFFLKPLFGESPRLVVTASHAKHAKHAKHGTQSLGTRLRVEFSKDMQHMQHMKDMMGSPRMRGFYHVLCAMFLWKVSRAVGCICLMRLEQEKRNRAIGHLLQAMQHLKQQHLACSYRMLISHAHIHCKSLQQHFGMMSLNAGDARSGS